MPLYDYKCTKCGFALSDVKQSFDEEAYTECPECKANGLERIIPIDAAWLQDSFVYQEPLTVGHLGHRRRERMGQYEKESKEKKLQDERLPGGPARRINKKLINATPEQRARYIRTGHI